MSEDKNKIKVKTKEKKVVKSELTIEEFCSLNHLNAYHTEVFCKLFKSEEKRTSNSWKKEILDKKLVDKKIFKIK